MLPSASVIFGTSRRPIVACSPGWTKPTTITANMLRMNTAAGTMSSLADSLIPNMLIPVSTTRPPSDTSRRWPARPGKTLPRLAAPAARLTATVST